MNFLRIFKKQKPTVLGRWSKLECNKALEKRIKLANIDNCGPCGLDKKEHENNREVKIKRVLLELFLFFATDSLSRFFS